MSKLLKDIYSVEFYNNFSEIIGEVVPAFDAEKFPRSRASLFQTRVGTILSNLDYP